MKSPPSKRWRAGLVLTTDGGDATGGDGANDTD